MGDMWSHLAHDVNNFLFWGSVGRGTCRGEGSPKLCGNMHVGQVAACSVPGRLLYVARSSSRQRAAPGRKSKWLPKRWGKWAHVTAGNEVELWVSLMVSRSVQYDMSVAPAITIPSEPLWGNMVCVLSEYRSFTWMYSRALLKLLITLTTR